MSSRQDPFVLLGIVIVGCLVAGVMLVLFTQTVPALVVSVVLACSVATLLYGFLGGVSAAGFNLGPLKVGGSAAVLLGSVWFFNGTLDPQLEAIRHEKRLEQLNFEALAAPPSGWFAVSENTGIPVEVKFTDPVTDSVLKTVAGHTPARLRLSLISGSGEGSARYWVVGTDAKAEQALGYVSRRDLVGTAHSFALRPRRVYGLQRLHLAREDDLPDGMVRRWGNTTCRGGSMPFEIEAVRFSGFAEYDLRSCDGAEGSPPDYSSSLYSGDAEIVQLVIDGRQRYFLIAVVASDHQLGSTEPAWSTFLVIEMEFATV